MTCNDLGFYLVNGLKYHNKIQALQACKNNEMPQWIFQDEKFSKHNWKIEPTEDIYELYKQRAMQIRLKYDRVVLYYSGGIDSTCVLHSFIDNNIPLDGIVSYGAFNIKNYDQYDRNKEIARVAQPYIRKLELERGIKLPYYLLDDWELFLKKFNDESWSIDTNPTSMSPETHIWNFHREHSYFQNHLMKGTTAVIRAMDKPRIIFENGTWKIAFLDANANGLFSTNASLNPTESLYHEYFYWTGDFPKILCKQAHIVSQYFESLNDSELVDRLFSRSSKKFKSSEYFKWIDPIIYSRYLTNKPGEARNYFTLGKTKRTHAWHKDDVFFQHADEKIQIIWREGIKYAMNTIDPMYLNCEDDLSLENFITTGFRGIWTRDYNIK